MLSHNGKIPIYEDKLEVLATKVTKETKENVKRLAKVMEISQSELNREALDSFIRNEADKRGVGDQLLPEAKKRVRQKDLSYRTEAKDVVA